jgi:hypothetical protein
MSRYQRPKPIKRTNAVPLGWTQHDKSDVSHDRIIALFEAVVAKPRYDGNEGIWDNVLELLNHPLCYQPAVSKVIQEGSWRNSRDPKAYVATAAYRQGLAMRLRDFTDRGITRVGANNDICNDKDGETVYLPDEDNNYRSSVKQQKESTDEGHLSAEERLERQQYHAAGHGQSDSGLWERVPKWLQHPVECNRIDWRIVAEHAALKANMVPDLALALKLRFDEHLTRSAAMLKAAGRSKQVEAAWKWMDRNWQSRIEPLFGMGRAPTSAHATPPRAGFIQPWKALHYVSRPKNDVSYISAPSLKQKTTIAPVKVSPIPGVSFKPRGGRLVAYPIPGVIVELMGYRGTFEAIISEYDLPYDLPCETTIWGDTWDAFSQELQNALNEIRDDANRIASREFSQKLREVLKIRDDAKRSARQ